MKSSSPGQPIWSICCSKKRGIEIVSPARPRNHGVAVHRAALNEQGVVLVDGTRYRFFDPGWRHIRENIPLSQDRIEIVYGPLKSSLYGADAGGRVIQIFTKQGEGAPHPSRHGRVRAIYADTRKVDASIAGSGNGDHTVALLARGCAR